MIIPEWAPYAWWVAGIVFYLAMKNLEAIEIKEREQNSKPSFFKSEEVE